MEVPSYNACCDAKCSLTKTQGLFVFHLGTEVTSCSKSDNIFLQKGHLKKINVELIFFKELRIFN